jgi:hypothetical protein
MVHVFEIMSSFTGFLNVLHSHYTNNGVIRTIDCPVSVSIAIGRANKEITGSEDEDVEISVISMVDTHDSFSPLYVAVADNGKSYYIEKIPMMVNKSDESGPGVGLLVVVPKVLFNNDFDVSKTLEILKEIYFDIANLDNDLEYEINNDMIFAGVNGDDNSVPIYDLTLALVCIGCIYSNAKSWFSGSTRDIIDLILGDRFPDANKSIASSIDKHCSKIGMIRDSISDGSLLYDSLFSE